MTSGPNIAVKVLNGSTQAWGAAGMPTATGMECPLSRENDIWWDKCESENATKKDLREYVEWEKALIEQMKREDEIVWNL